VRRHSPFCKQSVLPCRGCGAARILRIAALRAVISKASTKRSLLVTQGAVAKAYETFRAEWDMCRLEVKFCVKLCLEH